MTQCQSNVKVLSAMYQNSPQNLKKYYTREWTWGEKYSICLFWWSRDGDPIPGHEKLPEMSKVQLLNRSRELFQSYSLWEIFRPDHVSRSFRDKWKNCQSLLGNFKRAAEFNSYRKVENYFQLSHKAQLQQEKFLGPLYVCLQLINMSLKGDWRRIRRETIPEKNPFLWASN